ncbi:NRDE family protein [Paenibacillus koleovorans]|uniref:NRDE family protein n=1 Tax=Paenibacillus koleovorans TaxID=121608 RepID=UPI000FD7FDEE|nr:NRDE family protein [Paenibacillus koleovorans]
MCLILFAYRVHPVYQLVMVANRDEFYARPTAPIHYWSDHPHVLAGRDLLRSGTWMGVTTTGRFAALTNYRDPAEKADGKLSRGELVSAYLSCEESPLIYAERAALKRTEYPGYNLLIGDPNELYYYSNVGNEIRKLQPGVYGVSNHLLDTDWPKVTKGKQALEAQLADVRADRADPLFELLEDADPAPDEALPATGVPLEWERLLSSIFIESDRYGTRSSTVLLMTANRIHYVERTRTGELAEDRGYSIVF